MRGDLDLGILVDDLDRSVWNRGLGLIRDQSRDLCILAPGLGRWNSAEQGKRKEDGEYLASKANTASHRRTFPDFRG